MQLQFILSKHSREAYAIMGILSMLTSLHAKEGGWQLAGVSLQAKAMIERREYARILRQGSGCRGIHPSLGMPAAAETWRVESAHQQPCMYPPLSLQH